MQKDLIVYSSSILRTQFYQIYKTGLFIIHSQRIFFYSTYTVFFRICTIRTVFPRSLGHLVSYCNKNGSRLLGHTVSNKELTNDMVRWGAEGYPALRQWGGHHESLKANGSHFIWSCNVGGGPSQTYSFTRTQKKYYLYHVSKK